MFEEMRVLERESMKSFMSTCVVILVLKFLHQMFVFVRRQARLISMIGELPGSDLRKTHAFLADFHDFQKLPKIPGTKLDDLLLFYSNLMNKYSAEGHGLARVWLYNPFLMPFARPIVVIWDPELITQILGPENYGKCSKGRIYDRTKSIIGTGIIAMKDGSVWKHHRKITNASFSHSVLERTNDCVVKMLNNKLFCIFDEHEHKSLNITQSMSSLALDVIAEIAFSYDFKALDSLKNIQQSEPSLSQVYIKMFRIAFDMRKKPYRYFHIKERMEFRQLCNRLNSTIHSILEDRLNAKGGEDHNNRSNDLVSQLLKPDENGHRLSNEDIVENVKGFLFAGQDTTANSLSFIIWELANNPKIQERIRDESAPFFENNQNLTYDNLRKLPFLNAVVKEGLRLYPVAVFGRTPLEDIHLSSKGKKYVIPKGANIMAAPWITQRNSKYWENSTEFIPDRFLAARVDPANTHPEPDSAIKALGSYLPFSMGARNCIGQQLALAEMRAVITHLVHRYDMSPGDNAVAPSPACLLTVFPNRVDIKFKVRVLK